jgi:hypothetical protein
VPRLVLAVSILALTLAGCGGGTKTVTEIKTAPEGTADETTAPGTTTRSATETSTTETTASVPPGNHGPRYFETPTHNIGCYVDSHAARCDVRSRTWSPPREPASCKKIGLDFGQGIVVGQHRAEFVCAGDTSLGGKAVLGYGQSTRRGSLVCQSATAGVTCSNEAIHHGFFLSRDRYRLF